MKQKQLIFCMGLSAIALFASCNEREIDLNPNGGSGNSSKGSISLNLNADASFSTETRSLNEADYLNTANYTVEIYNVDKQKLVYTTKFNSFEPKLLDTDVTYEVRAFYGTEYAKSRDDFRMEGSSTFMLTKDGETRRLDVQCLPTCGKVTAEFDPAMDTYFSSYVIKFGGTAQLGSETFDWTKSDTNPWYIAIAKGNAGETVNYTINLKTKKEYTESGSENGIVTGSFTLKRNMAHKLFVKPSYTENVLGGLSVIVTIDAETNDKPITIEVPVTWI